MFQLIIIIAFQEKLKNGLISEHDLHVKRLQWELEQRQTQQKQCDEVEKSKEIILSEIQEESRILQSILPMLKDIRTVSLYFKILSLLKC